MLSSETRPALPPPPKPFLNDPRRVWIMGVMNVTPDSFYSASRAASGEAAVARAAAILEEGADVLDIGGESSRPGAQAIAAEEEIRRVCPLVETLRARHPQAVLSVDTQKASVARRALEAGASWINDISALRFDPDMAEVVAHAGVPVVLMHMQGRPDTMQNEPRYTDVVGEIRAFFEERLRVAETAGISKDNVILDPGIGFGKTLEHNLEILRRCRELADLGFPLLIGVSRKSFIGRLSEAGEGRTLPPEERLEGSLAAGLWAVQRGARGLRVHDVAATRKALAVWGALDGR